MLFVGYGMVSLWLLLWLGDMKFQGLINTLFAIGAVLVALGHMIRASKKKK